MIQRLDEILLESVLELGQLVVLLALDLVELPDQAFSERSKLL